MATTSATSGTSVIDKINNSRNQLASSEETFLKLLTTQMKNQDPLSPMDSNAFTGQIVQMTGVEQQLVTNDLLAALVGMNDGGIADAVNMMGKQATAETDTSVLKDGKANWSYTIGRNATSVKIEVLDKYGAVVATKLPDDMSKGEHTFEWDGKDSTTGVQQPNGAAYTLRITAVDGEGTKIATTNKGRIEGIVTAVTNESGQNMVTIDGVKVPISQVIGVTNPPEKTADASDKTPEDTAEAA
jgi:flagellar basal-body rod modification protein FlgD